MSSIGDSASDVTGVSSLNSVGEDKAVMFETYIDPLLIYPCWYELLLGTFRSRDQSVAPSGGEEHDAHNTVLLYNDTMHKDAIKFCDPLVSAPNEKVFKVTERIVAYNADGIDKVAHIDKREEECRKW